MRKTFTNTEEGKQVLYYVSQLISTEGMEVYRCTDCEDLYAGRPENVKNDLCGICETDREFEMRDAYGLENIVEDEDQDA